MSLIVLLFKGSSINSMIMIFQIIIYSGIAFLFGFLNNINHKKIFIAEFTSREKAKTLEASQRKIQQDLSLAAQVQKKLLPENPKNLNNFETALYHKSATGISGDFYDFYITENELTGVSLFDVSGHGIAAGLLTMLAKPTIYRNITKNEHLPLNEVMKKIDKNLSHDLHGMFQYLTGVILRFKNNKVEYINAAHSDIIHYSAATCELKRLSPPESISGNTILGVDFIKMEFNEINFEIQTGDFLFYFTDGLIDISNPQKEHYTIKRLMEFLDDLNFHKSPQSIINNIIADITKFADHIIPEDDITIIALKKL